jgi:hypothetical protein
MPYNRTIIAECGLWPFGFEWQGTVLVASRTVIVVIRLRVTSDSFGSKQDSDCGHSVSSDKWQFWQQAGQWLLPFGFEWQVTVLAASRKVIVAIRFRVTCDSFGRKQDSDCGHSVSSDKWQFWQQAGKWCGHSVSSDKWQFWQEAGQWLHLLLKKECDVV